MGALVVVVKPENPLEMEEEEEESVLELSIKVTLFLLLESWELSTAELLRSESELFLASCLG